MRAQTRIASVCSTNKGFTLLEIVIVIAIMGLIGLVVVPNLSSLRSGHVRRQFINNMQSITQQAWFEALSTGDIQRVLFDFNTRTVSVQTQRTEGDKTTYVDVGHGASLTTFVWPETLQVKDFFIEGVDILHLPGMKTNEAWFYAMPSGFTQAVILNFFDTTDATESEAGTRFSLVLSPFTARFTLYEAFYQP